MKFECIKSKFSEAVSMAEKITGKNLTLPVLSCVFIEAKNKNVVVRATNLDLGIEIVLPVKIEKEGVAAIPGQILNNFLNQSVGDKGVVIESVDGNVKIVSDYGNTVIKSLNTDDFPTIPKIEGGKGFKINSKEFIRGIKAVWYSSAISSMKPELSSVYIYSNEDGLVFVATDSFRLAEKKVKMKNMKDFGSVLIPVKNIPEIMRVLESSQEEVDVTISKNQISFSFSGVYLTSRVVEGVFPDYKQIVPKEHKTRVTALKQDVAGAVKVATIFSDKFNKISIKAAPKEKLFEFATKNADVGENTTKIEAVIVGEEIAINFNYRYITDCFQSIESDSLNFDFNGLTRPLIIRGASDNSFTYLVMPINK